MILKSLQYQMGYPLNKSILDNKVLIITARFQEHSVESSAYTITIRKMLEYVNSKQDQKPETVVQVVEWYCRDECLLTDSDCVEVFADQASAEQADEHYCDLTSELEQPSPEWVYAMTMGCYISYLSDELPQKVGYLG